MFENTLDREIEGKPSAEFLWQEKNIVPFLKVDKGLAELENGVQVMKPMPSLAQLLEKAKAQNVFGTKMRSFIAEANEAGIKAVIQPPAIARWDNNLHRLTTPIHEISGLVEF